jgi:oxaloacetate decarboxylase alpha subunit
MSLDEVRRGIGAPGISDEDLLLRAIMQGTSEIDAMRAAGPPRSYASAGMPLHTLVERLRETSRIGYVHVRRGTDSIVLRKRAPRDAAATAGQ